mgnify:FL=1
MQYKGHKLTMPKAMRDVVKAYERDNDTVLQFLESKCVKDNTATVKKKTLYDNYKSWCRGCGYYIFNFKKFCAEVAMHPDWYDDEKQQEYIGLTLGGGQ